MKPDIGNSDRSIRGIVIYKGKYGATKQYAEWIGEELELPVVSADNMPKDKLHEYDFLLIGTSVYIGKLQIAGWLKNNLPAIKNKKIFLFQVAATPPEEKEKLQTYIQSGVPAVIKDNCKIYFLQGKMIQMQLSWKDRFMLKIGAWLTKDPETKKAMLTDFNNVKKENIYGLVNTARSFLGSAGKKQQYA